LVAVMGVCGVWVTCRHADFSVDVQAKSTVEIWPIGRFLFRIVIGREFEPLYACD
jgi:hypothetical protein